jgi:hypothetical protein
MRSSILSILLGSSLFIAQPSYAADVTSACMADYLALCASVPLGGGRVTSCMKQHRAQVSAACKFAVLQQLALRKVSPSAETNP